jgi:EmrB/QacA subfamily drug resistance transporter
MTTDLPASDAIDPGLRKLIWVLVLGLLAPALDTTIVNVGLATIGAAMRTAVATSQWTITGYLLAMGMAMPVSTWAAERFGGKQVWLSSLAMFAAFSALSGAAWSITSLIVFRLIQGAAAGLMMTLGTKIITQAAGPARIGRAAAIASLTVVIVPVFGPVIGGLIISHLAWRWIFYVNVPVCLAALVLAWRSVPASAPAQHKPPLDVLGLALLSPGLGLIIYGLAQAAGPHGFAGTQAWLSLTAGLACTGAFVAHALATHDRPLIDLRVLRVRSFATATTVVFLAGLSVYGPLLLLALYYQQVQGKSVLATGLLLAPQGIGSLLPRSIAGKVTDFTGARPVVLTGLVLTLLGTLPFAWAGPATNPWLLAGALFVRGAGLSAVTIAVIAGAFKDVSPGNVPDANSTIRIVQQVGGSFGAAILAIILASKLLGHDALTAATRGLAFDTAFWWAAGFTALTLLPALLIPAVSQDRADRAKRSTETVSPRTGEQEGGGEHHGPFSINK